MRLGPAQLVAQIEFLKWAERDRLEFIGRREEKDPRSVVKEHSELLQERPMPPDSSSVTEWGEWNQAGLWYSL